MKKIFALLLLIVFAGIGMNSKRIVSAFCLDVNVISPEIENGLVTIPYSAINQDDNGNEYVFVLSEGALIRRTIAVGKERRNCAEIINGISADEKVALNPDEISESGAVFFKYIYQ